MVLVTSGYPGSITAISFSHILAEQNKKEICYFGIIEVARTKRFPEQIIY